MSNRPTNAFVEVRGDDINGALRALKKQMQRGGVLADIKRKQFHKTKGQIEAEKAKKSVRRNYKAAVRAFVQEGLTREEAVIAVNTKQPRPKVRRSPR